MVIFFQWDSVNASASVCSHSLPLSPLTETSPDSQPQGPDVKETIQTDSATGETYMYLTYSVHIFSTEAVHRVHTRMRSLGWNETVGQLCKKAAWSWTLDILCFLSSAGRQQLISWGIFAGLSKVKQRRGCLTLLFYSKPVWLVDAVLLGGRQTKKPANSADSGQTFDKWRKKERQGESVLVTETAKRKSDRELKEVRRIYCNPKGKCILGGNVLLFSQTDSPSSAFLFYYSPFKWKKTRTTLMSGSTVHGLFSVTSIPPVRSLQCCKTCPFLQDSTYKTTSHIPMKNIC